MKKHTTLIISLVLILSYGCETTNSINNLVKRDGYRSKYYSIPNTEESKVESWGNAILISRYVIFLNDYIHLKESISVWGKRDYHPEGDYKRIGRLNNYIVYENQTDSSKIGSFSSQYAKLFEDEYGNLYYDYQKKDSIISPNKFKKLVENEDATYEIRLIPVGVDDNTITLLYEFVDKMAILNGINSMISEKKVKDTLVKFDLDNGSTIKYKSAIIEILKCDNQNIEYKVISPFSKDEILSEGIQR